MKIVFVNRYFYPDISATSQILTDLATDLADSGAEVHVVTSRQLYSHADSRLPATEQVGAVRTHRVWTSRYGRASLAGRAIDYATFYASAAIKLLQLLRRGDIVVAKTDPPLVSTVAAAAARARGAILVNWFQDIFPEIAERLSVPMARGLVLRTAKRLRDLSVKAAAVNVVIAERMASELISVAKAPASKIAVIHNWADGIGLTPTEPRANPLRHAWALDGKFVVAYSGNLGRAHEVATIVDAIERLRREADLAFLFVGSGSSSDWLRNEIARMGLQGSVHFHPYQPRELLSSSLGAGDVHLVTLRPELEGLIVPSKFYGIAAVGRPTIFVGDVAGEIALQVRQNSCGLAVAAGNGLALSEAILTLKRDRILCAGMGVRARALFDARFDRRLALRHWQNVLEGAKQG